MSRPRIFSKAEILDAARAAAETGMCARLRKTGEIEFIHSINNNEPDENDDAPDKALERWMNENQPRRRA